MQLPWLCNKRDGWHRSPTGVRMAIELNVHRGGSCGPVSCRCWSEGVPPAGFEPATHGSGITLPVDSPQDICSSRGFQEFMVGVTGTGSHQFAPRVAPRIWP